MIFYIFLNTFKIFQNFLKILKLPFSKFEVITVKLLVESLEKFLSMIWNLVTKSYPKFLRFRLFLKMKKFMWILKTQRIHSIRKIVPVT